MVSGICRATRRSGLVCHSSKGESGQGMPVRWAVEGRMAMARSSNALQSLPSRLAPHAAVRTRFALAERSARQSCAPTDSEGL